MLKDITIGQHFPGDSIVHRTDPRLKILLVIAYIVLLFTINNFLGLALSLVLLAGLYLLAKIPLRIIIKSLNPIIPIIAFTAILNLFFMGGEGEPLIHFWVIKVYKEGIAYAIFMAVRIVALIAGTGLLTYTTSPIVLTDAIERLLSPFAKLGLPVHELAMMMTIALRFIPTLIEETDKIMSAQKARGADFESGGLMDKAKSLVPIMVPLFVSSFRRADELALAMECRCYHGGAGRTRMRQLKYQGVDYAGFAVSLLVLAAVVAVNAYFPSIY